MNATPLAAFPFRHPARVRIALVALACALVLAPACANPLTHSSRSPRCADLIAHSFASANVPVHGAYACLAANVRQAAAGVGIVDDASLAANAAIAPVYTAYTYKYSRFDQKAARLYYYFEFTPGPYCLRIGLNTSGLVDAGEWTSNSGGACPAK